MLLKRSLSLFLCALLALSLCAALPRTAKAAADDLYVDGTLIPPNSYWRNDGAGGVMQEGADASNYNVYYNGSVLTLQDAFITKHPSAGPEFAVVYKHGGLDIELKGENVLRVTDSTPFGRHSYGIHVTDSLHLFGSGRLTAIGGPTTAAYSHGISAYNMTVSRCTVTAIGGTASNSRGVQATNSVTVQNSGTLIATGGTAITQSYGVRSNRAVTVQDGGTLIATGGETTYSNSISYGVEIVDGSPITLSGGLTVARSGRAATSMAMKPKPNPTAPMALLTGDWDESYAVYGDANAYAVIDATHPISLQNDGGTANWLDYTGTYKPVDSSGHFTWNGSTLTLTDVIINTAQVNAIKLPAGATLTFHGASVVKGYDSTHGTDGSSYGIYGDGGLTLNGDGSIIAIGGTVTTNAESYGVRSAGALTLGGSGSLTAIGGTTTNNMKGSYGIYGSDVTLSDGRVTAIGGTASDANSYGMYGGSAITAEGGALTAMGGTAAALFSYGMYGESITVKDGMIAALGGTAGSSYGMQAIMDVTIKGGAVTALGGTADSTNTSISIGIFGAASVTVEKGAVRALGGAAGNSYGARGRAVAVKDGTVTTAGGAGSNASLGVRGENSITLTGGTTTATGSSSALSKLPTFLDAQQTNGRWYMWKTDPALTYTKSSGTVQYVFNSDQYLKVTPAMDAPVITTTALSDGVVGTPYSKTLQATPAATSWSLLGNWPLGLSFAPDSGVLSGTPGPYTDGSYSLTATARNEGGDSAPQELTLIIRSALTFTHSAAYDIPAGKVGTAITSINVSGGAAGGVTPYMFSLENAPGWLSVTNGGVITGTRPNTAQGETTVTVRVADSGAPAQSKTIAIQVGAVTETTVAPAITTQPTPQTITAGNAATFTVTASGFPAPTYQWQVSTDGGSTWNNAVGGTGDTSASYTTPSTTGSMNGWQYRCIATNSAGSAISDPAALTVYVPAPNVDVSPARLSFGSFPAGSVPAAQVVTVTNRDGNTMGLELPQDNDLIITAVEGFTGNHALIPSGGSAKFSVQPKSTLPIGSYSNTIRLVFRNSTVFDIPVSFTVTPASGGNSSSIAGGGADTTSQYVGAWNANVLTVQAPCDKCVSVIVDNVQLKENADYIKECGSTIVTFTPSYLATLKNGTHSIRVQFTDGRYDGTFITPLSAAIATVAIPNVPATGSAPLWMLPLALLGLLGAAYKRRRE